MTAKASRAARPRSFFPPPSPFPKRQSIIIFKGCQEFEMGTVGVEGVGVIVVDEVPDDKAPDDLLAPPPSSPPSLPVAPPGFQHRGSSDIRFRQSS